MIKEMTFYQTVAHCDGPGKGRKCEIRSALALSVDGSGMVKVLQERGWTVVGNGCVCPTCTKLRKGEEDAEETDLLHSRGTSTGEGKAPRAS